MYKFTVKQKGKEKAIGFDEPMALQTLLRLVDDTFDFPCAGNGRCGNCKIRVTGAVSGPDEKERELLTEKEMSDNVRLACRVKVLGDACIYLEKNSEMQIVAETAKRKFAKKPLTDNYGMAIDIGTTTVCAVMYDLKTCSEMGSVQMKNSQSKYGADIISRIEYALDGGADELRECITDVLNNMFSSFEDYIIKKTDSVVITGNTTMLYLLTGTDTECLSHSPFEPKEHFGKSFTAEELGLKLGKNCRVYIPPCISAFVGADITCAVLSSGITEKKEISLLADMGTNGELVLWHNGTLYCCSTAAGPVFEGAGIKHGMLAMKGAIDSVYLKNAKVEVTTIGGAEPRGICGSGIIDAVAVFRSLGVIDETGAITDGGQFYSDLVKNEREILLGNGITVTQDDIRNIQLAKAAIFAGIKTLLNEKNVSDEKISTVYIAGGFGKHINLKNASIIGLLSEELSKKSVSIGNAALSGAAMILQNKDFRIDVKKLVKRAEKVNLPSRESFAETYIDAMAL